MNYLTPVADVSDGTLGMPEAINSLHNRYTARVTHMAYTPLA